MQPPMAECSICSCLSSLEVLIGHQPFSAQINVEKQVRNRWSVKIDEYLYIRRGVTCGSGVQNIIPLIPHNGTESAICQLCRWDTLSAERQSQKNSKKFSMFGRTFVMCFQYCEGSVAGQLKYETNAGSLNPAS
jgi:hypothetical protein